MTVLSRSTLALTTALLLATDSAERTRAPGKATAPDLDPERTSQSMLMLLGALGIVVLLVVVIVVAVVRKPRD